MPGHFINVTFMCPKMYHRKELATIKANIEKTRASSDNEGGSGVAGKFAPLLKKPVMAPLLISLALMMFQQWCGVNAIIFYTVSIFEDAGTDIDSNFATVIVGVVQFLATFSELDEGLTKEHDNVDDKFLFSFHLPCGQGWQEDPPHPLWRDNGCVHRIGRCLLLSQVCGLQRRL